MLMLWLLCLLVGTISSGYVKQQAPQMNPPQPWGQGPSSYPSPGVEVYAAPEEGGYPDEDTSSPYVGPVFSEPEVQETTEGSEEEEPVFSDVSNLEPVFSISSRSSYQRGRAMFSQSRYIPGAPAPPPPMPVFRVSSSVPLRRRPADVPVKEGFE
ncbi:uncharacterized protein LOC103379620 isoform X2 [Cynoglossus semilaevis]|uniref:uncharacterized protein LOC103379620 isoform X2 n=1 Tax=Cynoglossus semilaevis TaxID=244447 RepID=UPI0004970CAA|nr:uncharacterized protein LOC103379620 isoform X2 [Cynoglossus semilaevis]